MSDDVVMLWCRRCLEAQPAVSPFCTKHPSEELVPLPAAAEQDDRATDHAEDDGPDEPRTVCWNCETLATRVDQNNCAHCHESLVPPALVIDFAGGSVVVRARGTSAELGRAGTYGHVFVRYPNVSRWHATVSVDGGAQSWLTPNPAAPNGTFVNDTEILSRTPVGPGDRIRFAADHGPNIGPTSERIRQPLLDPVRQRVDDT